MNDRGDGLCFRHRRDSPPLARECDKLIAMKSARLLFAVELAASCQAQQMDWTKIDAEGLHHLQALVQIDSSNGMETRVVDYVKKVFDAEGIPSIVVAKDPNRANLIADRKSTRLNS